MWWGGGGPHYKVCSENEAYPRLWLVYLPGQEALWDKLPEAVLTLKLAVVRSQEEGMQMQKRALRSR